MGAMLIRASQVVHQAEPFAALRLIPLAIYSIDNIPAQFEFYALNKCMDFKKYLFGEEAGQIKESGDVQETLAKLPKSHKKLLSGYKFSFQGGNTLKGDDGHIGSNDLHKKTIVVSAPWNYGREFALLHEIGHVIYMYLIGPCKHKTEQWKKVVRNTKAEKVNQDIEELFCHAYANTYAKNKIVIHNHPTWEKFVKELS